MKIISKFKDYYDYLVSLYGVDEKIIYERHSTSGVDIFNGRLYELWVCNEVFYGVGMNNKISWELNDLIEHSSKEYDNPHFLYWLYKKTNKNYGLNWWYITHPPVFKNINTLKNCPIVIYCGSSVSQVLNPNLSLINFKEILPHDMWVKLSEWFSPKDIKITQSPEDMVLFESKGFDKKTSFRKM